MSEPVATSPLERGTTVVAKRANRTTRLATGLSIAIVGGVGTALLVGYYSSLAATPPAEERKQKAQQAVANNDMRLPRLVWPDFRSGTATESSESAADAAAGAADDAHAAGESDTDGVAVDAAVTEDTAEWAAPEPPRLSPAARHVRAVARVPTADVVAEHEPSVWYRPVATSTASSDRTSAKRERTAIDAVAAVQLPSRRYLVPRGATLDCTLRTAIDSTLAGLATCVTATDLYGADGSVVLLERGTELVGQVLSDVRPGQERVGVRWEEARTPAGVLVRLDSPATDALGRAGLAGEVDRHFGDRFGAALLLSVIDASLQAVVAAQRDGGTVVVEPRGASDVATEILRNTVAIPPTIRVAQGSRVQVIAARHLDFESVYRLTQADPGAR